MVSRGKDRIRAGLKGTSEFWVAMILVTMNRVSMFREAPYFGLRSTVDFLEKIVLSTVEEMHVCWMVDILRF